MQIYLSRTALVCACALALASAQITFSRDWTGGKRAPAAPCDQLARLCRHFVHELQQVLAAPVRRAGPDEVPPFDDDK